MQFWPVEHFFHHKRVLVVTSSEIHTLVKATLTIKKDAKYKSIILNVYACLHKLRRYFASLSRNLDASLISLQSELDALIVIHYS